VQLERQARLPLSVGHLEEVDLRHCARDVEQRVDAAKCGKRLIDHSLGRGRFGEVEVENRRFGACGLHRFRGLVEMGAVPRREDESGEVAREAYGRRPADTLARTGDDGD
jgi:hypothetical protein